MLYIDLPPANIQCMPVCIKHIQIHVIIIQCFMHLYTCTCTSSAVSATLGVMLNSSLNEDLSAHDQQDVFFTCTVQGSSNVILEWSSAEYIGQGGFPLQLLSLNGTSTNVSSTTHPSTYAVRRSVSIENELTEITSDLRIIASLQYPMGTVTCSASANGASSSRNISFQTRGKIRYQIVAGKLGFLSPYSHWRNFYPVTFFCPVLIIT